MERREFLKLSLAGGAALLFDAPSFAAALADGSRPKTLVLGGGAFALGYALAHPNETLVLERGIHLAADFACTCGPFEPGEPRTALGRELAEGLEKCGILADGRLELPPLADYMSVFFADHGGRAFVNAELAALEKSPRGYRVKVCGGGADGISEFAVGDVIDTTDVGFRNVGADALVGKRFGGIGPDGYFTVDLPADADWHTARLALYRAWEATGRKPEQLLAEVNALKCLYGKGRIVRRQKDGYDWVPSAQFPTLLDAFEEGIAWKSA